MLSISVIVPVHNEAQIIQQQLDRLKTLDILEIIVVDGASTDGTARMLQMEKNPRLRTFGAHRSRARQQNKGGQEARGEWLLFLHADTVLPAESYDRLVRTIRENPEMDAGAFYLEMDAVGWYFSYLTWYSRWRSRWFKMPYGDQAVFVRKRIFDELGGFREDHPIMEDVEFVRRLNRRAHFRMIDANVITSARRFLKDGALKRGFKNLFIQLLYIAGVRPIRLAKLY
ncbi:MAG: TIGR04283 family arsenosugar biosynthesis glycosyltransferase [Bacteroidetes bacterium]|nr:TIGR04283 family arsenosugar biosynthesis glycosyltransferase [Bacteroidota bacterium]